jgi:nucleoside 2-deoxyribosyltransferase
MIRRRVYLAGPIAHLTYDEAQAWRNEAIAYLAEFGIEGRSPLRGKEFLRSVGKIGIDTFNEALASDEGIVTRDRYDVRTSDLMLVNLLGAHTVSSGTPAEYGWADAFGIPVITVIEREGSPYDHPFIRGLSGYRVETLEEGLDICRVILN